MMNTLFIVSMREKRTRKMKVAERKAFAEIDENFIIMLRAKREKDIKMVKYVYITIGGQIDLLQTMQLIDDDGWDFMYNAIEFVKSKMEVA